MYSTANKVFSTSLIVSAMLLAGCNSSSSSSSDPEPQPDPQPTVKVQTPADLTNVSAENVDDNQSGLVSANTVYNWVNDWENNRPEHITGRLVIIQVGTAMSGESPYKYIKHNGDSVMTFDSSCCNFSETRNDGVSNVPSSLPPGALMDENLKLLGVNPNEDMILFVSATGGSGIMQATRRWYTMAYWGIPPQNLAVMNGSAINQFNPTINANINELSDIFVATADTPPNDGTTSIKDVLYDATSIVASMGDMMAVVTSDAPHLVVDARSENEYNGLVALKQSKTEEKTCGDDGKQQCYTAFEGHIKGAANVDYVTLYNADDQSVDVNGDGKVDTLDASYTFKDRTDLENIYASAGYQEGDTLYTYCRTGTRASINTFVQMQILGYPTAMYDGSWIQWGKMADATDKNGETLLAPESRWRVDVEAHSGAIAYNPDYLNVQQINGLNADADSTQSIVDADKAYKQPSSD